MRGRNHALFAAVVCIVLAGCSQSTVQSGGGSGTETVGIVGYALTADSACAANASVRLRRADFLDTFMTPVFGKKNVFLADATTNDSGFFAFPLVDSGVYCVEIVDGAGNAALNRCTVTAADSLYRLGANVLSATGAIVGKAGAIRAADSVRFDVAVFGLAARRTVSDYNGNFMLGEIPPGAHRLYFAPSIPLYERCDTVVVSVFAGSVAEAGDIGIPVVDVGIHPGDSGALWAILDINGLGAASGVVMAVAPQWPRRIASLSFTSGTLTDLTPHIGKCAGLCTLVVNGNALTSVPAELGNCKSLKMLNVRNNRITTIPPEIGSLDSLRTLDIAFNELTGLPAEIGRLRRMVSLDARYNRIAALPQDIGMCRALRTLLLTGNLLTTLPQEIAYLSAAQDFRADSNEIAVLPQQITMLRPPVPFITISANKLCVLPMPEIAGWLDMYCVGGSAWRIQQRCP